MNDTRLARLVVIILFLLMGSFIYSQNTQCQNPTPFCTAVPMNFPAQVGVGNAQPGPNYGCLGGQPNPAWFFMQMATAGSISVNISAQFDVDFIAWGPFPSLNGVCANLTGGNQVPVGAGNNGCSFSGSPTETLILANAQVGEFYVVLVTNWSGQVQNINMNQTGGTASTNCGIICSVTPVASGPICPGGTASLSAITGTSVNTYTWTGPNGFLSNNTTHIVSGLQTSTTFTFAGSTSNGSCQATAVVTVVPLPVFIPTPTLITVCQNGSFLANVTIGFPSNYTYQWSTTSNLLNFGAPTFPTTFIQTAPITTSVATVYYNVVVTPTILNCPATRQLTVQINNPATPTLTMPAPLCNNMSATTVTASPPGGTWYGNPIVSSNGIVTPGIANVFGIFPVNYSTSIGQCTVSNQANLSINQFRTAQLFGTVPNQCEQNNPFNLMTIVQNTNGAWAGVGVQANNKYFDPNNIPTGTYVLTYFNSSFPNPNVCPMSATTAVQVFNPLTPTISPIGPRCSNSPTVMLNATPGGGTWSANSGVNIFGTMNPANVPNTSGVNSVVYTAGQGTCLASSTATFHVSRFNTAALTSNGLNLCYNSSPVNLMALVQNTINGAWTGSYTVNDFFTPVSSSTPTYVLRYKTNSTPNYVANASPPMKDCRDSSYLQISVISPVQPTLAPAGPYCTADAPIQLAVSPSTGSFVVTPYLTATGILTPSFTTGGSAAIQYVVGTNTCNLSDAKQISIEDFVPALITGVLPDQCVTSSVVNLTTLVPNIGTWSGPGVLGGSFNPATSGVGNLVITHHTSSSPSGLCPDQQSLSLAVYSLAPLVISPEGPFCTSHVPVTIKATPVGGVFVSSSSHAVSPNGLFNPAFAAIGNNVINYSVSAGPCLGFLSTMIKVEEFVTADFSDYVLPLCRNSSAVELNTHVQRTGGTWSGPGILSSIFTPSNANVGNNNIIVYRTHSETPYLCPDSSAMRITVIDVPDLNVITDVQKGCVPLQVKLNIPNINNGDGTWVIGDGSEINGLTATHTFSAPGTYSVLFNYWTPETRCPTQALLLEPIQVFDVPHPSFRYGPYDEVTISDPEVQFENSTVDLGNSTYQWQIANMYILSDVNPKVTFPQTGEYRITLLATNVQGCKNEVSDVIVVQPEFRVFIPNSFSPNFDGVNDEFFPVFSPFGLDKSTYEMEIFDRWGKSVFLTKDITKAWNGTIQNKGADPLKEEVFLYKIKFRDLEGRVYNKLGNVTLLK